MLHSEPSLSIYNNNDGVEEKTLGNEDLEGNELVKKDGVTVLGSQFSFGKNTMALLDEDVDGEEGKEEILSEFKDPGIEDDAVSSMPVDAGLGRDGGGLDSGPSGFDLNGNVEEYCEKMIREDLSNPLFLRNYAQIVQDKGNFVEAEDFYLCAALADPTDGENLLQYAKLVWVNHHDKDKALKYFKMAADAAPQDSHVLAAYASFLWDIDEEESSASDEDRQVEEFGCPADHCNTVIVEENRSASLPLHLATGLGINSAGFQSMNGSVDCVTGDYGDSTGQEGHYKRIIEENLSDPSILKNYARWLRELRARKAPSSIMIMPIKAYCEILLSFNIENEKDVEMLNPGYDVEMTREDLQAAEKYYLCAIQVDPSDGEVIVEYAQLIWQLRRHSREALPYFKQAVEAAPENSNVLAAYARFLWETEEEEEEEEEEDTIQWDNKSYTPALQETAITANA